MSIVNIDEESDKKKEIKTKKQQPTQRKIKFKIPMNKPTASREQKEVLPSQQEIMEYAMQRQNQMSVVNSARNLATSVLAVPIKQEKRKIFENKLKNNRIES
jgi:hypothetical protein